MLDSQLIIDLLIIKSIYQLIFVVNCVDVVQKSIFFVPINIWFINHICWFFCQNSEVWGALGRERGAGGKKFLHICDVLMESYRLVYEFWESAIGPVWPTYSAEPSAIVLSSQNTVPKRNKINILKMARLLSKLSQISIGLKSDGSGPIGPSYD